ncbi:MAG: hypothetical protein Q8Q41_00745 [bacterium]|nr:hypothetical protein [bacterium]
MDRDAYTGFDDIPSRNQILARMREEGKGAHIGMLGHLMVDFDWCDMAQTYRDASNWQDIPNPADTVKCIFTEKRKGSFIVIRLGRTWGDILAPGDRLILHIIPDRDKPEEVIAIGSGSVESVTKKYVTLLTPMELLLHVGAHTIHDVCEELTAVHRKPVHYSVMDPDVVTVIRMRPSAFFSFVAKSRKMGKKVVKGGFQF